MVESGVVNWLEERKESSEMLGSRLSGLRFVEEEDIISLSSLSDVHSVEEEYEEDDESDEDSCAFMERRLDLIKSFRIHIPDKQQWIDSWLKNEGYASNISREDTYSINLYGYYKKEKDIGGYGVLLRDPGGRPVSAFVWSSKGRSYLYYLFKGLRRGLKLALAHGLRCEVKFYCNSMRLTRIVDVMIDNQTYCVHRHKHRHLRKRMKFCEQCAKVQVFNDVKKSEFKQLFPIIKDVQRMGVLFGIDFVPTRRGNKAA